MVHWEFSVELNNKFKTTTSKIEIVYKKKSWAKQLQNHLINQVLNVFISDIQPILRFSCFPSYSPPVHPTRKDLSKLAFALVYCQLKAAQAHCIHGELLTMETSWGFHCITGNPYNSHLEIRSSTLDRVWLRLLTFYKQPHCGCSWSRFCVSLSLDRSQSVRKIASCLSALYQNAHIRRNRSAIFLSFISGLLQSCCLGVISRKWARFKFRFACTTLFQIFFVVDVQLGVGFRDTRVWCEISSLGWWASRSDDTSDALTSDLRFPVRVTQGVAHVLRCKLRTGLSGKSAV